MKKNLLKVFVTAAAFIPAFCISAEVITVDGINYNLLEDGSGVEVTEGSYTGEITIPAIIKNGSVSYRVVAVGKNAFQTSEVTKVTLPNTVREIKNLAFNASDVVEVNLGTGVEKILDGAFSVCRDLEKISEIPASCTYIDGGVFMMNDKLKAINVSADNPAYKSVDGVMFTKAGTKLVNYPNGHGTEYVIPEGTDSIDTNVFSTNQDIAKVTFPSTLKYVGLGAFTYCTAMETNELPDGLETVCANAFSNCRKMATKVPASIKYIGSMAFNNCFKITEATIADDVTLFGRQSFNNASSLTKVTFEENPKYVTEIDDFVFQSCSKLSEVIIPEGYTKIGGYAFSGCKAVNRVELPSTLTEVSVAAFANVNPEIIICRAIVPPTYTNESYHLFGTTCFKTVPVYVPDESIEAYKAAWIWKFFENYKPLSELNNGVDSVDSEFAEVVSTTYYDFQGIEVAEPAAGKAYIVKSIYSDGTVKTKKAVIR